MSRQGKWKPRTAQNIKAFWTSEAADWGEDPRVTIRDHYFRLLCLWEILAHVESRRRLLDVGCGSGFGTLIYSTRVELAVGMDYAPPMIKSAKKLIVDRTYRDSILSKYYFGRDVSVRNNVLLEVGDITKLAFPDKFFDAVVCERVIVNLPRRTTQCDAVREIARVLDRAGIAAIAEASIQGHQNIDRLRGQFGLSPMEKYWHNLYIDEFEFLRESERNNLDLQTTVRFETYQFLSKVVYPCIIEPEEPDFLSKFNLSAYNVAQKFPTYADVEKIGMAKFLRSVFLPELLRRDEVLGGRAETAIGMGKFDEVNFSNCSHQVLFVFKKS